MPSTLSLDYETYCDIDLRRVGVDVYTSHPSFEVLLAAYRIDKQPLQHWECHEGPVPRELNEALLDPHVRRWAYNATFERVVTRRGLGIDTPIEGWRCAMALAFMHSFVGGLLDVGEQMRLPVDTQKQKIGGKLIKLFCMPQKLTKKNRHVRRNWDTDPEEWDAFVDYCKQDVVAEEGLRDRLIRYPVPDDEWQLYELDQLVNDRGMPVDLQFVENIRWMADWRRREILGEMQEITGLVNANSIQQLLPWLQANGYPYDDVRQDSVRRALVRSVELWGTTDHPVVEVLQRRLWASKTSTAKADAALLSAGAGDRIRYMYQFAGASRTNRWSGKLTQPQNLARTPKIFDAEHDTSRLDCATNYIRRGDYDACELYVEEPMMMFSGCMRGMFRAQDDEEFQVCDYSSIESAGLAWVTGCERLLEVFRSGRDPYYDFGTLFYGKPYDEITRAERQICKPPALGCGYGMGPGKVVDGVKTGLLKYAESMGVEMEPAQAEHAVRVYRTGYPEVVQFWKDCQNAAHRVVRSHKGMAVGPLYFDWIKPYFLIRLPSGRHIYYYHPMMTTQTVVTERWTRVYERGVLVREEPETYERTVLTCMGRNQRTTKWDRIEVRGAHICENIVQALCRDILKVGLTRLHKDGFNLVGHAHDEAIALSRTGDNYYTWQRMREIMRQPIDWAPGFPLNANGWAGQYYRK